MTTTMRNLAIAVFACGVFFIIGCQNSSNSSSSGTSAAPAAMTATKKQYAPAPGYPGTKYVHDTRVKTN